MKTKRRNSITLAAALACCCSSVAWAEAPLDGDLYPLWGDNGSGTVHLDFGMKAIFVDAVKLPGGKALLIGIKEGGGIAMAKLTAGGAPDHSFGGTGYVTLEPPLSIPQINTHFTPTTATLDLAGNLLIGGFYASENSPNDWDFGVCRISVNTGATITFDGGAASCAGAPITVENSPEQRNVPFEIFVEPDGKIILIGTVGGFNGNGSGGAARLLPNGTVDYSYADSGRKIFRGANYGHLNLYGAARQPDGRIVYTGMTDKGGVVGRLNALGQPEPLNNGGEWLISVPVSPRGVALSPKQDILVTGQDVNGTSLVVKMPGANPTMLDADFNNSKGYLDLKKPMDAGMLSSIVAYGTSGFFVSGIKPDTVYALAVAPTGKMNTQFGNSGIGLMPAASNTIYPPAIFVDGDRLVQAYPCKVKSKDSLCATSRYLDRIFADGFE